MDAPIEGITRECGPAVSKWMRLGRTARSVGCGGAGVLGWRPSFGWRRCNREVRVQPRLGCCLGCTLCATEVRVLVGIAALDSLSCSHMRRGEGRPVGGDVIRMRVGCER